MVLVLGFQGRAFAPPSQQKYEQRLSTLPLQVAAPCFRGVNVLRTAEEERRPPHKTPSSYNNRSRDGICGESEAHTSKKKDGEV